MSGAGNEESCEDNRRIVDVALVVEPVVVPVPALVVPVEIERVPVAVAVAQERTRNHLYHCPSNLLRAVSDPR